MNVQGQSCRTIWLEPDGRTVGIIDQLALPHEMRIASLHSLADMEEAIRAMRVRGAPLIGAAAAYGLALAMHEDAGDAGVARAVDRLLRTRPTAVNLQWALTRAAAALRSTRPEERADAAYRIAARICDEDVEINRRIGAHGLKLIREIAGRKPGEPVQVLTHCNAGWLATVDWGTALSPVYHAVREAIPIHVWVAETRPRLQGALTSWELTQEHVPHTIIVDSAAAHLMQRRRVDLVITGADRVTALGDVANKVGTYMKALAARDNDVPFYAAVPTPSIDFAMQDGIASTPIEERSTRELTWMRGTTADGRTLEVRVLPAAASALNVAFDVTPARLVTGLITEHGVVPADPQGLAGLARTIEAAAGADR
ncbi:MAG TPA: S-methyl-5-thioribose-1-phosphate isomerase [Longimicrobiales bacterium]